MLKKILVIMSFIFSHQFLYGDIFIKIGDIEGESLRENYQGYSDVLSWSWGSTSNARSTCIQDIDLVKFVDKASAILLMDQVTNTIYPTARLAVTTDSAEINEEYLVLDLKNVRMLSLATESSSDKRVKEKIKLNFEVVTYTYKSFADDGSQNPPVSATISSKGKC